MLQGKIEKAKNKLDSYDEDTPKKTNNLNKLIKLNFKSKKLNNLSHMNLQKTLKLTETNDIDKNDFTNTSNYKESINLNKKKIKIDEDFDFKKFQKKKKGLWSNFTSMFGCH